MPRLSRRELAVAWNLFFDKYDLLLTPTVAVQPFDGAEEPAARARTARPNALWSPYTATFNLTPPSRRLGAVRPQPRGPADRPADRGGPFQGRARAARGRRAMPRRIPLKFPVLPETK